MKRRVGRLLFGERRSPQYAVLGTEEPQSLVRVVLTGAGEPLDVTRNNVTVSLRPMRAGTAGHTFQPVPAFAGDSLWLFALRSTTPAVEVIRRTRRMTVSAIAVELRDVAYALGRNHRVRYADAAAHPFVTIPSPSFGLPAPGEALRVTDFDVVDLLEPGSHTVFVARQRSELQPNTGLRMCHVQGFYQEWSSRQERTTAAAWNRGES